MWYACAMKATLAGKCSNCGSRDPVLRAVYDWQRTQTEGRWTWLGTSRPLCPGCYADPRFGGRWIDERKKPTAQKPAWAAEEPEEFARPTPPVRTGPVPTQFVPIEPSANKPRTAKPRALKTNTAAKESAPAKRPKPRSGSPGRARRATKPRK